MRMIILKRILTIFSIITCTAALAGCGNIGLCRNKCAPGLVHDSFCGCQDYSKIGSAQPPSVERPACICQYDNGLIGAWFTHRPSRFGEENQSVRVTATKCESMAVCGPNPDRLTYLTGSMSIEPQQWTETTNLLNGSKVWLLVGRIVRDNGAIRGNITYLAMAIDSYIRSTQRLLTSESLTNDVNGCQLLCRNRSPFCKTFFLSEKEARGLRKLHAALLDNSTSLRQMDLMRMFDVRDDPCSRGDTSILGGRLLNTGAACSLVAEIPGLGVNIKISVPPVVEGEIEEEMGLVGLSLTGEGTRPYLEFKAVNQADTRAKVTALRLQADWGGEIKWVFGDADRFGFGVGEESCVRAEIGSN